MEAARRFWEPLIAAVRRAVPGTCFIAWTPGTPQRAVAELAGSGFDLVTSSLPWWDFRAGWWPAETEHLGAVAPVLMAPEAPFAQRLFAMQTDRAAGEQAARRALRFAAVGGAAWLMPMGFEYGALHRMGHAHDEAEVFAALRRAPRLDLTTTIREANALRSSLPADMASLPPQVLSAPGAPVALLRGAPAVPGKAVRTLVLANPSLEQPARLSAAQLLGLLARPGSLPPESLDSEGRPAPFPRRGTMHADP